MTWVKRTVLKLAIGDQLAAAVTGLCSMQGGPDGPPSVMNCAACDYITGYLATLGVLAAVQRRAREGGSWEVRAALAQTGRWLRDLAAPPEMSAPVDLSDPAGYFIENDTPIGRLRHPGSAVRMSATPARWTLPATPVGQHLPVWGAATVQ